MLNAEIEVSNTSGRQLDMDLRIETPYSAPQRHIGSHFLDLANIAAFQQGCVLIPD